MPVDEALMTVLKQQADHEDFLKSQDGARPAAPVRGVVNHGITPEMQAEREASHSSTGVRPTPLPAQAAPVAITKEMVMEFAKHYGLSFQDGAEMHGGVIAEHEATIEGLKADIEAMRATNAKLVERANREAKDATDVKADNAVLKDENAALKFQVEKLAAMPPAPASNTFNAVDRDGNSLGVGEGIPEDATNISAPIRVVNKEGKDLGTARFYTDPNCDPPVADPAEAK